MFLAVEFKFETILPKRICFDGLSGHSKLYEEGSVTIYMSYMLIGRYFLFNLYRKHTAATNFRKAVVLGHIDEYKHLNLLKFV